MHIYKRPGRKFLRTLVLLYKHKFSFLLRFLDSLVFLVFSCFLFVVFLTILSVWCLRNFIHSHTHTHFGNYVKVCVNKHAQDRTDCTVRKSLVYAYLAHFKVSLCIYFILHLFCPVTLFIFIEEPQKFLRSSHSFYICHNIDN